MVIYWSDEEIETLCRMINKGKSYKEVAKKLGRTVSACQTQYHNCQYRVDKLSVKIKEEENGRRSN